MKYQRDRVLFEERLIIESLTIRIASVDYDTRNANKSPQIGVVKNKSTFIIAENAARAICTIWDY